MASRHTCGYCSATLCEWKWEREREREILYHEMVKMDFSPKLISRTPSSHPKADVSSPPSSPPPPPPQSRWWRDPTDLEWQHQLRSVSWTDHGQWRNQTFATADFASMGWIYDYGHTGAWRLLFPPVIVMMSSLIVEIAGVFNRNLISLRGLVFAIALLEHFPGDTHCVNVCGFGCGVKTC